MLKQKFEPKKALPAFVSLAIYSTARLQIFAFFGWLAVYFRPSKLRSSIAIIRAATTHGQSRSEIKRYLNATLFLVVALLVSCLRTQPYDDALAEVSRSVILFLPILFWALSLAFLSQEKWEDRFWRFQVGVGLIALLAWIQYLFGLPAGIPIPGLDGRFYVTLGFHHPLQAAAILVFPILMAFIGQIGSDQLSPARRVQMTVFLVFGVTALFFTYSKTVWLGLAISVLLSAVIRLPPKRAFLAGLGGGAVFLLLSQHPALQLRLHEGIPFSTYQTDWATRFSVFAEFGPYEWLFGMGILPTQFGLGQFLLEIVRGNGLIGLAAFLYWWSQVLIIGVNRLAQARPGELTLGLGFLMGAFCFFVINTAQIVFWTPEVLFTLAVSVAWILPRVVNKDS